MLNIVHRLVPDDTVKLSHTPPSYVTQGRLILDITISSWSINRFSVLFLYFILQVKPRLETSQGAPPPHQTAGNSGNSNPLRSMSSRYRRVGYRKISAVYPTTANTGIIRPSLLVLLLPTRMTITFS